MLGGHLVALRGAFVVLGCFGVGVSGHVILLRSSCDLAERTEARYRSPGRRQPRQSKSSTPCGVSRSPRLLAIAEVVFDCSAAPWNLLNAAAFTKTLTSAASGGCHVWLGDYLSHHCADRGRARIRHRGRNRIRGREDRVRGGVDRVPHFGRARVLRSGHTVDRVEIAAVRFTRPVAPPT